MKRNDEGCSSQQIEEYLKDGLSQSAQIEFEQHLCTCSRCREELESKAAEPEEWNDAVALLTQPSNDLSVEYCNERRAAGVLDSLAPSDEPDMLGRIGEYEVSGVVGLGGMGAVLKGFDRSLGRVVAIKVMAPHLADSGSARSRFQREARAAAAITHDNVIDIYGVCESNGLPYIVMPYARGPSLQKRIDDGGPLSTTEVVRIGLQIADGLAAAHEQGLVHRDIKPANILLSDGIERLWITDFGVARCMDDASMTKTGIIAGTPQYMSPEQARGEEVDQRSDLFSLGSVLYTSCTGRPPFRSEAAYGILRRITDADARPIREINAEIPTWLCRMIGRLMAKHPADRFGSASEVADLLENCLAHLQQPTSVDLPQSICAPTSKVEFEQEPQAATNLAKTTSYRFLKTGVWIMISALLLAGSGVFALQLSGPADVSGQWRGELWQNVSLSTVEEADDWYAGTLVDRNGRRGAVQLEWSRLQRRYNGRWKIGTEQSGSITMRVGDGGVVQGAISVDPGSSITENVPMLREFSWTRGKDRKAATSTPLAIGNTPSTKSNDLESSATVRSPTDGVVGWLSDSVVLGAEVQAGEVLARIHPYDNTALEELKRQLAIFKQRVLSNEIVLESSTRNMASNKEVVQAFLSQLETLEQVKQRVADSKTGPLTSAEKRIEAAKQGVTASESRREKLTQDAKTAMKTAERGLSSRQDQMRREDKINEAEAALAARRLDLQNAIDQLAVVLNETVAKEQRAQVDIDVATIALKKAEADYGKTEGEVKKAQSALKTTIQQVKDLQSRISQFQRVDIRAPQGGKATMLAPLGTALKKGQVLCVIQVDHHDQ